MSDGQIARRDPRAILANPGRLFAGVWDSFWGCLLLAMAFTVEALGARAEGISYTILFALFAATAAFNRDFSRVRVGPVYVTEVGLAVLAFVLAGLLYRRRAVLLPRERTCRWILALLLTYIAVGTLRLGAEFAGGLSAGILDTLRNYALVYYAAFGVIGWLVFQRAGTQKMIREILAAMVVLSTATSLWTAITYWMGLTPRVEDTDFDPTKVIQGHAAVFAMLSMLIIVHALRYRPWARYRVLFLPLLILNGLFIYLSGHRSAVIGIGAGIATMMLSSKHPLHKRIPWRWVAMGAVVAGLAWHFFSSYFLSSSLLDYALKFETLASPMDEANAAWRAGFWLNVIFLWLGSPIYGVGFSHDFINEEPLHLQNFDHYDPHNSYLAILARGGIVTLLVVGAAAFLFVRLMIRVVRHSHSEETAFLAGCLLSCFGALGAFAGANVTLESPYHAIFFWLFIGMGVALGEKHASTKRELRRLAATAE